MPFHFKVSKNCNQIQNTEIYNSCYFLYTSLSNFQHTFMPLVFKIDVSISHLWVTSNTPKVNI